MAHKKGNFIYHFFTSLGPGLVTGASDDDPSGIATYSQAGAQFGFATLWTALITFPLMAVIQEMCARVGAKTGDGLATIIKKNYSMVMLYFILLFTAPAIILNIGADIAGMGAVTNLLIPAIPEYVFSILFTIFIIVMMIFTSYQKVAAYLKYLCLVLLLYLFVPFLIKQDWGMIARNTFLPTVHFNKEFISILVAIFGTTISPYLFFWQATMEAEEKKHHHKRTGAKIKIDVLSGMFVSNLVMYAIILTTASVLFKNGIHQIETVEQAAKALEPIGGKFCYLLFSIGVIGTGLLSIPVLSASLAYMIGAVFGVSSGLDKKYHQAKLFYIIITVSLLLGLLIPILEISVINILIVTAIFYGMIAPLLIVIILMISNNKKIMGSQTNGFMSNMLGLLVFLMMASSALLLVYYQFV